MDGAMAFGAVTMRNRSHSPGAGFTERGELLQGSGGDASSIAIEDKSVASAATTTVNGTLSGATDWAAVAVEIKPLSPGSPAQYSLTINTVGSGSVALSPTGGTYDSGTAVTLTATPAIGFQFSGWSGDLSGTTNPATITMNANKSVTATFTQLPPSQYTLTVNTNGSGSVALNPTGGVYDSGTVVTLTAAAASGFQFSEWSGDLSSSANPTTITMNANKSVIANFTTAGGSGTVVYEETKIGGSSSSTTVATSASLTSVGGHLYLAAISTKPRVTVTAVSGLGLTWTLVKAQCSGRNATGIELWMAQGAPSGNGVVTATFSSAPINAAIDVSRYSGAATANPVGNVVSGNTRGSNGVCSGGTDTNTYSFNLSVTMNGAMAYGAATMRNRSHSPGAGFTERAEILQGSAGDAASIAVQDKGIAAAATVTVNGAFSGATDWAAVAVEIKPQGAATAARQVETEGQNAASSSSPIEGYRLEQIYPNPFNAESTIEYVLLKESAVELRIYNAFGQLVRRLVEAHQPAGQHRVGWNARDDEGKEVGAGVYFVRLEGGARPITRKITLLK
jgi:uncharacterized repeat protein (TIGR02543 family)